MFHYLSCIEVSGEQISATKFSLGRSACNKYCNRRFVCFEKENFHGCLIAVSESFLTKIVSDCQLQKMPRIFPLVKERKNVKNKVVWLVGC